MSHVRLSNLLPLSSAPSFQLVFRPSVHLISLVRRFVADFYEKTINDRNAVSRLALTTHELLENAAKYSNDGATSLYIEVDPAGETVLVRTTNSATPEQIASLRKWFAELQSTADVSALYAEMVRRTATLKTGSGGLGLARIAAEGDMEMELVVTGGQVEIVARGRIDTAG